MVLCLCYCNGLLGEAMVEQSAGQRTSAIEAEGEFVQVVVEMLLLLTALMSSHHPSLEQRVHLMNPSHHHVSRIETAADDTDLMLVAQRLRRA